MAIGNFLEKMAYDWTRSEAPEQIKDEYYCATRDVFQARLDSMVSFLLAGKVAEGDAYMLAAIAGEIGNNSFDHNLGKWPDIPGVFFGYDVTKRQVVLADRGLGILSTLSRVRPELKTHVDALRVAFTEVVSGRAPEARGNGLKFVRRVVAENPVSLFFLSGDAELRLKKDNNELFITWSQSITRGCFAVIEY